MYFLLSKNKLVFICKKQTKNDSQWSNLFFSVTWAERSSKVRKEYSAEFCVGEGDDRGLPTGSFIKCLMGWQWISKFA